MLKVTTDLYIYIYMHSKSFTILTPFVIFNYFI